MAKEHPKRERLNEPLEPVSAHPVKTFFVHMLTRDILLQDAILDLVDNSVDGIQRSAPVEVLKKKRPYDGYWAKLTLNKDRFVIEDNCGGIPWEAHEYAFRMGRASVDVVKGRRTVGTYGIGMKRAIFKIGEECVVTTHSSDLSYRIHIPQNWMQREDDWDLQAVRIPPSKDLGTKIEVTGIREGATAEFQSSHFENSLRDAIATHYAYIMQKGMRIELNGKEVTPKAIRILYEAEGPQAKLRHHIRPFIYKTKWEGVSVFLVVGFSSPIPSKDEVDEGLENYKEKYSSAEAGWTVICNDRTVLYYDKSPLTGWGVSGVPQYHTQFTAISGTVSFIADDARKLPTTTTKRGIDMSSTLYLHVRDKMIEGMKIFTQYTNQWKSKELAAQSRERMKTIESLDMEAIETETASLTLTPTRGVIQGHQYKPELPKPVVIRTTERISFQRPTADVKRVSSYLFGNPNSDAKSVGEKCFDSVLEEAQQ